MERPRIRLTQGKAKRKVVELEGRITLGRVGSVDLPIADAKASREHARIFEQGGEWHVVDLNSTNGTLVNGSRITRWTLRPGDEITIGQTVFVFEQPEPAKAEEVPGETVEPATAAAAPPAPVTRRPASEPPTPAAAPAGSGSADDIVIKQKSLHYHRIEGKRSVNPLLEDVGQRGGLFRLVLWIVLALVAVGIFVGAIQLGRSLVSPEDDPGVYEEEYEDEG
jgi:hypothetical protein